MGTDFTLLLLHNGEVYSWGHNEYGQLGRDFGENSEIPMKINISGIVAIAAGQHHALLLDSKFSLFFHFLVTLRFKIKDKYTVLEVT